MATSLTSNTLTLDDSTILKSNSDGNLYLNNTTADMQIPTIKAMVDLIYPIGSIYISTNATNPKVLFGYGEWEQLKEGQFLMNTKLSSKANTEIQAGLPNIEGKFTHRNICSTNTTATGPFSVETSSMTYSTGWSNYDNEQGYIKFDASAYNHIYGNSTTVQPYSLAVYMWKRVESAEV